MDVIANRKLWTDALRSGKYEQGQMYLRSKENKFCCLGVLCDIAGEKWEANDYRYRIGHCVAVATEKAKEFVGLASGGGTYGHRSLWQDNDIQELSFPEIADIIDSAPAGLFEEPSDV